MLRATSHRIIAPVGSLIAAALFVVAGASTACNTTARPAGRGAARRGRRPCDEGRADLGPAAGRAVGHADVAGPGDGQLRGGRRGAERADSDRHRGPPGDRARPAGFAREAVRAGFRRERPAPDGGPARDGSGPDEAARGRGDCLGSLRGRDPRRRPRQLRARHAPHGPGAARAGGTRDGAVADEGRRGVLPAGVRLGAGAEGQPRRPASVLRPGQEEARRHLDPGARRGHRLRASRSAGRVHPAEHPGRGGRPDPPAQAPHGAPGAVRGADLAEAPGRIPRGVLPERGCSAARSRT